MLPQRLAIEGCMKVEIKLRGPLDCPAPVIVVATRFYKVPVSDIPVIVDVVRSDNTTQLDTLVDQRSDKF